MFILKKEKLTALLTFLITSMLISCSIENTNNSEGTLTINLSELVSSRTIEPGINMTPAKYDISGIGTNGSSFNSTTNESVYKVSGLEVGMWDITVNAYNVDNKLIGSGSKSINIEANKDTTLPITVTPLAGTGVLDLTVNWIEADIANPVVSGSLESTATNTVTQLTFVNGISSASSNSNTLEAGYYTLILKLLDGTTEVMGGAEVIRIVANEVTTGVYDFNKINKLINGSVTVNITSDMKEPLAISVSGSVETKKVSETLTLTGDVPLATGTLNYKWYVNGNQVATTQSYIFDNTWKLGYYRIDVAAYNSDGTQAGSTTFNIEVVEETKVFIPFITEWNTEAKTVGNKTITIPLIKNEIYDFIIDWGDGKSNRIQSSTDTGRTHIYSTPGIYTVSMTGIINGLGFFTDTSNANLLSNIKQWGSFKFAKNGYSFYACQKLIITATDIPDLTGLTSLESTFSNCVSITTIPNINDWNITNIINLRGMFFAAVKFNSDISRWDVSNVTIMTGLFGTASVFNSEISNWNVSKVQNMAGMFRNSRKFNSDISKWNVSNVTSMMSMFEGASLFNQDISKWNVQKVTDMSAMFFYAEMFNQNISNWKVDNVTNMYAMFEGASLFNQNISSWNVSKVTNLNSMFKYAKKFNQNIESWNVTNVKDMQMMFFNASVYNQSLGAWNVSNVTNMYGMLSGTMLDANNYDSTLNSWASLPTLQSNVDFWSPVKSTAAANSSLRKLVDVYKWTIYENGQIVQ